VEDITYRITPLAMTLSDLLLFETFLAPIPQGIAHINYDVFTLELESARGLQFQLCYWNWRTFQGHSQSFTW